MPNSIGDYIAPFYERHQTEKITRSVICRAPSLYLVEEVIAIRPVSADPANPGHKTLQLQTIRLNEIGRFQETISLPHKDLGLASNEELIACKTKLRPVLILSRAQHGQLPKTGRFVSSFLCVPLYTLFDPMGNPKRGHSPVLIEEIRHLQFSTMCHLPYDAKLYDREGYLRFDRIQSVCAGNLKPIGLRLSKAALAFVEGWFQWFCTGQLDEKLAEIRDLFTSVLEESKAENTKLSK